MTRFAVAFPAAARPYPGEVRASDVPVTDEPLERRLAALAALTACRGTTKAGKPCGGRPGTDGRCAAHKE